MRCRSVHRNALAALAVTLCAVVTAPIPCSADPARDPVGVAVDALASLAPAIIGAAAGPADVTTGSSRASILAQARQLLANSALPPPIAKILASVITFLDGSGGGGPKIPRDVPVIAQFLYPTIGKACITDTADSVGTALAVPVPAKLPPPGVRAGQTGFVFTALGTQPAVPAQPDPMTVTWLNLDNHRSQTQVLTNAAHINPAGPTTLSVISDTGPGRVVAVISGGLATKSAAPGKPPRSCSFVPTIGLFSVP